MKTTLIVVVCCSIFSSINAAAQSWVPVGNPGFGDSIVEYLSIAIDRNATPYLAYANSLDSAKAKVLKYDGTNWVEVGNLGITTGGVVGTFICIDTAGTPYVLFSDNDSGYKATVMKFDGSNWVALGNRDFSAGAASWATMALDRNGIPYVFYGDNAFNGRASVMKFNGSSWVYVGSPGFSSKEIISQSIAIDTNEVPYVIFAMYDSALMMIDSYCVMKYSDSIWSTIGLFSTNLRRQSLAINKNGTLFITSANEGYVLKYNDSSWDTVGTNFPLHCTRNILIDKNGKLYSLLDSCLVEKSGVVKFDSASSLSWVNLGTSHFPEYSRKADWGSVYNGIASDRNGTIHIAFPDYSYNGRITVLKFDTTSVESVGKLQAGTSSFSVSPNPATAEFVVSAIDIIHSIIITNVLGQVIYQRSNNTEKMHIDVSSFSPGLYFIRINGAEASTFAKQ